MNQQRPSRFVPVQPMAVTDGTVVHASIKACADGVVWLVMTVEAGVLVVRFSWQK